MSVKKSKRDLVSEEAFSIQMGNSSTSPEDDSPADSESDAGAEFVAGINYMPGEDGETSIADRDLSTENAEAVDKISGKVRNMREIPESSRVVNSDQPEPWSDTV